MCSARQKLAGKQENFRAFRRTISYAAKICTPVSQQYIVPHVCRKWGIQFSLVEARTEILEILLGRVMYITREFQRVVLLWVQLSCPWK